MILVGRTGLDQHLRRDPRVELVRAKDTIDAIGELSDPIDHESPMRAAVIVAASVEPGDDEIDGFISSLRLIDHQVRVLRVGSPRQPYDGCINPDATGEQALHAIEHAEPRTNPQTINNIRFVELSPPPIEEPAEEPVEESVEESCEESTPPMDSEPEVVVKVNASNFEHRAQRSFEHESDLHQSVILGPDDEPAQADVSASGSVHGAGHDQPQRRDACADGALVRAMLAGRSILGPAIDQISSSLGRTDIEFVPSNTAEPSDQLNPAGISIMVGNKLVGTLVCQDQAWAMGDGHAMLVERGDWLSAWIKLEVQQAQLRQGAFTDALTGAWNRRYFSRYLDAAIVESRSARQPLTVMLFDIDGFKHYNDTYGHGAGDEILIETVKLLKSVIRPSDRVCRVGGDEFAVIFYEPQGPRDPESKPLESVYQIARRFQQQICTHRFPKLGIEAMGTLTVSGGLASYPWDGHDSESLLEQADQLAMASKRNGKNAITLGPGAESVCKCPPTSDD